MKVVCRSFETYIELCVEKYELVRPLAWKTTTLGGRMPVLNASNVRWFASYACLPGIEKLWYQRFETWPAAKPPKRVRTSQAPMIHQRRRAITCARRASKRVLLSQV